MSKNINIHSCNKKHCTFIKFNETYVENSKGGPDVDFSLFADADGDADTSFQYLRMRLRMRILFNLQEFQPQMRDN